MIGTVVKWWHLFEREPGMQVFNPFMFVRIKTQQL